MARIDAVVLTGGSAFGLASAEGAVRYCEEQGMGFPTVGGPVPIVVAMALFDLGVGSATIRPTGDDGYAACVAATAGPVATGAVGAGTGATVGKWRGREHARAAGLGGAVQRHGELVVAALVAVNAFGDVDDGAGVPRLAPGPSDGAAFGNTTIGVVATNARLDKVGCLVVAQGGHDGLARALAPAHTRVDGDALVAAATGIVDADVDVVRELAVITVERAAREGATTLGSP